MFRQGPEFHFKISCVIRDKQVRDKESQLYQQNMAKTEISIQEIRLSQKIIGSGSLRESARANVSPPFSDSVCGW